MNISVAGKKALICGSTQGIGLAIAKELALNGATCVLLARNEAKLKEAVAALPSGATQQHTFFVADFEKNDEIKVVAEKLGKQDIQILVNNTGGPSPGLIAEENTDKFVAAFQQHIINYQLLTQAVLPAMKKAKYGRIINIISTSVKMPIANLGASNIVRAATAAWAKTLSGEVAADGITVNNILPGFIETARLESLIANNAKKQNVSEEEVRSKMIAEIPAHRFGATAELAALAAFLASPAAAYINGVSIPVDGGKTGTLS